MDKSFKAFAEKYTNELADLKSEQDSSDDFSVQLACLIKIVAIEKTVEILEDYHAWLSD